MITGVLSKCTVEQIKATTVIELLERAHQVDRVKFFA
jgi:hypothetical protein